MVNHVVSGVRVREEFYFNIAYEVTLVVVQSLMLISKSLGERPVFTFRRIKENIGYRELEGLRAQIAEIDDPEAEETLMNLDQILSSPAGLLLQGFLEPSHRYNLPQFGLRGRNYRKGPRKQVHRTP